MIFPTAETITPCLIGRLSPEPRKAWKERYRTTKKYGLRVGFGLVSGIGCWTLVKEAAKDGVKRHAKRYIGYILVNSGLTCVPSCRESDCYLFSNEATDFVGVFTDGLPSTNYFESTFNSGVFR